MNRPTLNPARRQAWNATLAKLGSKPGRLRKTALAAAISTIALSTPALAQITTEFSASGTTGTFQISDTQLYDLTQLGVAGPSTYNYNSQFFNPSVSGNYTFGTSKATFDTVIIVYTGSYNPAAPATNALVLNDDSGGAQSGLGLVNAGTCATANWCSEVTQPLTAGTDYYIVTTTYNAGTAIAGDVWYYVVGPGGVGVGGTPYVPPPPAVSVFTSSSNLTNSPTFGAARIIDATPGLLNLFTNLSGDRAVSNAASQTLPLLTGGSQIASQNALNGINRVIQARMDTNRGMSSGDVFEGDKNFWVKPFGSRATQDDNNGVSGYKAETYGLAAGVDGTVGPALRLGMAFAYASSNIDNRSNIAKQSASVDVYQLVGYGSYSIDERTELNLQVDVGRNNNDGKRTIAFTNTVAKADYHSTSAHIGVGLGRSFALAPQTRIIPSVRLDYTWMRDGSYSEKGAGLLNLDVKGRSTEALVLGIDGKLTHQLSERALITANLGVGYDTINERSSITAAFAGAPGAAFVTYGIDPSPWIGQAGFGMVYQARNGLEISGRYDAEHRTGFLNHTASMKVRWAF